MENDMRRVGGKYLASESGRRDVLLRTMDGRYIEATVQIDPFSDKGVVLLHQKGGTKKDYRDLQLKLANAGFTSIAVNYRGNENSGTLEDKHHYLKPDDSDNSIFQDLWKDAIAGKEFLIKEAHVDPDKIALVGGSIGSSTAVRTLAHDPNFQAVVLLSPGVKYIGIDIMEDLKKFPDIPTFITYATKAKNEDFSANMVKNMHPNPKNVVISPIPADFSQGHATNAFKFRPSLMDDIVSFIKKKCELI